MTSRVAAKVGPFCWMSKKTDKSSEYLNTDVTRDDNVRGITVTHALCSLQTVSNAELTS